MLMKCLPIYPMTISRVFLPTIISLHHLRKESSKESSITRKNVVGILFRPIPHTRFLNALLDADIVMNSSISEGFPAVVGNVLSIVMCR